MYLKKTTAKLSLALFLGISFCYCFFWNFLNSFFLKNRRFFLIHHFFTFYLLCYFSDPYKYFVVTPSILKYIFLSFLSFYNMFFNSMSSSFQIQKIKKMKKMNTPKVRSLAPNSNLYMQKTTQY